MTDFGRVYRLVVRRAAPAEAVAGFDAFFFEEQEVVTEISEQRLEFKIEKHLKKQPNTCELTLTNLSEETRNEFVQNKVRLTLEAGYDRTLRLLFNGDLRYGPSEFDGTEWQTKLQLADGGRAYAEARVTKSFTKGTPLLTVFGECARAFGLSLPREVTENAELRTQIATGEVLAGYASDELTRLLAPFGYEWSFQDGKLQILRFDEVRAGSIRVIDRDGGMIGAPTIEAPKPTGAKKTKKAKVPKLTIKHLLYPEVTPGEKIEVRSRSVSGTFRVDQVNHEGDSHGGDWTTTIEGTEI